MSEKSGLLPRDPRGGGLKEREGRREKEGRRREQGEEMDRLLGLTQRQMYLLKVSSLFYPSFFSIIV